MPAGRVSDLARLKLGSLQRPGAGREATGTGGGRTSPALRRAIPAWGSGCGRRKSTATKSCRPSVHAACQELAPPAPAHQEEGSACDQQDGARVTMTFKAGCGGPRGWRPALVEPSCLVKTHGILPERTQGAPAGSDCGGEAASDRPPPSGSYKHRQDPG